MSVVVSSLNVFQDAQQAARAFHERGELGTFVTGLALQPGNIVERAANYCLPPRFNEKINKELRRRAIAEIPSDHVVSYPWLDGIRTMLARYAENPIWADMVWDAMSRKFDINVARRHLHHASAVYAFEYTALQTFERAKAEGVVTILAMPSLDSKQFEEIKSREESQFPELRSKHHGYFARRFPARYERRKTEIALADIVIANSEMTRQSHVRAGADPRKIVSVPLAAPVPVDTIRVPSSSHDALRVVWAGNFSVGKGAHYFLDAWRGLTAGNRAHARVYGAVGVPARVLESLPQGFELCGSIPQQRLFEAFAQADVLAFPTLSDGFGAVVLEAFSRGLPVITTRSAGASEFVDHGKNGLIVAPANAAALTDALQWCLDNRDALYNMRFAALQAARHWQWPDYRRTLIAKIAERFGSIDVGPKLEPDSRSAPGAP